VEVLEVYIQVCRAWLAGVTSVKPGQSINTEDPTLIPAFLVGGAHGGVLLASLL
jgi:hypothetical protein